MTNVFGRDKIQLPLICSYTYGPPFLVTLCRTSDGWYRWMGEVKNLLFWLQVSSL